MGVVKKFSITSTALALMLTTSACGAGNTANTSATGDKQKPATTTDSKPTDSNTSKTPVTITYSRGKDTTGATTKLIAGFEKSHPDIKVKFMELPSDSGQQHDQYVTMFNAGSSDVDVLDIDVVWPAEFAQAGYLLPLDDLLGKDNVKLTDYNTGAVEAASFNGKQWAMPRFIDTGLLLYRKDIVSTPPATWEELVTQAKANKGKGGTKYSYLMQSKQYEGLVCNAIEFIAAYGGQVVDDKGNIAINSPGTIKGLNMMKEIVSSDFVPKDITTYTETETESGLLSGSTVFVRNWPYNYATAQDGSKSKVAGKIGVAPLPKGDARSAAALGGWMSAINKNSKHIKESWEFLKYTTSAEGEKISALEGGSAPTLMKLYDDSDIKAKNEIFADPGFVKGISASVSRPVSPVYPKLSDIMQTEISKFLTGKQSAEEAVKAMDTKMKDATKK
jgi:multiple sugar transport system substrate-binding protein